MHVRAHCYDVYGKYTLADSALGVCFSSFALAEHCLSDYECASAILPLPSTRARRLGRADTEIAFA